LTNILNFVELDILNDDLIHKTSAKTTSSAIPLHPDWNLAAWSVDRSPNSLGVVDGTRGAAFFLLQALKRFENKGDSEAVGFALLHLYTVAHAVSLVTYTSTNSTSPPPANDPIHPTLSYWGSAQLWKYGTDSRTSKLGIAIILAGCLIVLGRTALYLEDAKSPTELVVQALRHPVPAQKIDEESGAPLRVSYARKVEQGDDVTGPMRMLPRRRTSEFLFMHPESGPGSPAVSP
jgi:hypothetical protein